MIRSCPARGGVGEKRFPSSVVETKFSATTFASRKSPELMHHALALCQVCSSLFVETPPNSKELIQNYVEASFDSQVESEFAAKTYVKYLAKLRLLRGKKSSRHWLRRWHFYKTSPSVRCVQRAWC